MIPKMCRKCNQPRTEYYKSSNTKDGFDYYCIPCRKVYMKTQREKHAEKRKAQKKAWYYANQRHAISKSRKWYKDHTDRHRDGRFRRVYGITLVEYNALLEKQGGTCAVCHRPPGRLRLAVDHDHTSGKVRGLLCQACNQGLGFFKDHPNLLADAIEYLIPFQT